MFFKGTKQLSDDTLFRNLFHSYAQQRPASRPIRQPFNRPINWFPHCSCRLLLSQHLPHNRAFPPMLRRDVVSSIMAKYEWMLFCWLQEDHHPLGMDVSGIYLISLLQCPISLSFQCEVKFYSLSFQTKLVIIFVIYCDDVAPELEIGSLSFKARRNRSSTGKAS